MTKTDFQHDPNTTAVYASQQQPHQEVGYQHVHSSSSFLTLYDQSVIENQTKYPIESTSHYLSNDYIDGYRKDDQQLQNQVSYESNATTTQRTSGNQSDSPINLMSNLEPLSYVTSNGYRYHYPYMLPYPYQYNASIDEYYYHGTNEVAPFPPTNHTHHPSFLNTNDPNYTYTFNQVYNERYQLPHMQCQMMESPIREYSSDRLEREIQIPHTTNQHPRFSVDADVTQKKKGNLDDIFALCIQGEWRLILQMLMHQPQLAETELIMGNNLSTTILHQAVTKRKKKDDRLLLINHILQTAPDAVSIKNGYGSLPIHAIVQRNTAIDATSKECIIRQLAHAYPESVAIPSGISHRTPLHILFTDYYSPELTQELITIAPEACSLKDKKGYLPAHVACSRHCSPAKLRMLLDVYPNALEETTNDNHTLLSLAESTATGKHPNHALIDEIRHQLRNRQIVQVLDVTNMQTDDDPTRVDINIVNPKYLDDVKILSSGKQTVQSKRTVSRRYKQVHRNCPSNNTRTSIDMTAGSHAFVGKNDSNQRNPVDVDLLLNFSRGTIAGSIFNNTSDNFAHVTSTSVRQSDFTNDENIDLQERMKSNTSFQHKQIGSTREMSPMNLTEI